MRRPAVRMATIALTTAMLLSAAPNLSATAASASSVQVTHGRGADLLAKHYRSIADVRSSVVSGREAAVSVVKSYLAVVEKKESTINAMITLNPNALKQAHALDVRIRAGKKVGVLAGVPFVVKDNMDVKGLPTTGGSIGLANNYAATTAPVVQRLLDQGAILIGKTNMSEFAASYGRLGYSSQGGLTLNPANTRRDASGSSSGSAAAVASGMAVFGLGTDTSGSVRGPASVTGMVGLRPSHGLNPTKGIIPLASSFDVVGAITASVADQAIVDSVMAGGKAGRALSTVPKLAGKKGLRVGVVRAFMGGDPQVDRAVDRSLAGLRKKGVSVTNVAVPADFSNLFSNVLGPVGDAEFASEFERYLAGAPASTIKTLPELIAFYESAGAQASPNPVNPARLEGLKVAQAKRDTLSSTQIQAILTRTMPQLRTKVRAILAAKHLDALVFPTMSCVATPRWDIKDSTYHCASSDPYTADYLASATGFPEVTVPIAKDTQGLPIGLSFLGTSNTEPRLLGYGALAFKRR